MNLDAFINQVLVSIANGVSETQELLKETNTIVNPSIVKDGYINDRGNRKVTDISFDVAVTVKEEGDSEKGAKVNVAMLSLGGGINTKTTNEVVSRISFSIPIALPVSDKLDKEAMQKQVKAMRYIANSF